MGIGLYFILGVVFLAVSGALMIFLTALVSAHDQRARRLQELKEGRPQIQVGMRKRKKAEDPDPAPMLTGLLQQTPMGKKLQVELLRAGLLLRPSEFLIIALIVMVTAATIGFVVGAHVIFGIIFAVVGAWAPFLFMRSKQGYRQRQLSGQIPDALDLLSSSLRSGHSFLRGMQVVVTQLNPPITEEFERVVDEVRLGMSVEAALGNLVARTGNYDLELIVSAVQTQLSVGGNLAEVLDNIAGMIRERVRLAGEISAATAEGRMSAIILGGMPFAMAFLVSAISPGYIQPMFESPFGLMLLGIAGGMMLFGILIIRSMLDIDI